jgi:6-phosphogluconolactonase
MVSRDGRKLLVANYSMGDGGPGQAVVIFGIRADGGLTAPLASIARTGNGPDPGRQERSHAHSVTELLTPDLAVVADRGTDSLVTYRIDSDGALTEVVVVSTAPGAGPRHVTLHPNGRLLFVMKELDSTIASYRVDPVSGSLARLDV